MVSNIQKGLPAFPLPRGVCLQQETLRIHPECRLDPRQISSESKKEVPSKGGSSNDGFLGSVLNHVDPLEVEEPTLGVDTLSRSNPMSSKRDSER